MNDLKKLKSLFKEKLPPGIDVNAVEAELRRYLSALNTGNKVNSNDALDNLETLLNVPEIDKRGIPGQPQENTVLTAKVIELFNETVSHLQLQSPVQAKSTLQNPTNLADENAEEHKNN